MVTPPLDMLIRYLLYSRNHRNSKHSTVVGCRQLYPKSGIWRFVCVASAYLAGNRLNRSIPPLTGSFPPLSIPYPTCSPLTQPVHPLPNLFTPYPTCSSLTQPVHPLPNLFIPYPTCSSLTQPVHPLPNLFTLT